MKPREFSIRLGKTINTGNFESKRVDVECKAILEESDDPEVAQEELYDNTLEMLNDTVAAFRRE